MKKIIRNIVGKILKQHLTIDIKEGIAPKHVIGDPCTGEIKYIYGKTYHVRLIFNGEIISSSYIFKGE